MKTLITSAILFSSFMISSCAHYGSEQHGLDVMADLVITSRVKTALLTEKSINSLDISVETFDGTVQLAGFVDTRWQIERAGQITAAIYRVQQVNNNLIFSPGKRKIRREAERRAKQDSQFALSVCYRTEPLMTASDNYNGKAPREDDCTERPQIHR